MSAQSCSTLRTHGLCPPGSSVHGTSRQEYWSGFPFPTPGDLPNPGIEPMSLLSPAVACRLFTTLYHLGSPDQFLNKVNFSTHAMGLHLPHREMSHNSPNPRATAWLHWAEKPGLNGFVVFVYSTCLEDFAIKLGLCFITPDLTRAMCNVQHTYHITCVNSVFSWIPRHIWLHRCVDLWSWNLQNSLPMDSQLPRYDRLV